VQVNAQEPLLQVTSHLAELVQVTLLLVPMLSRQRALLQVKTLLGPAVQVQTLCAVQSPLQESEQLPLQVLTSLQLSIPPRPASQMQVAPALHVHISAAQPQCGPGQGDTIEELPQPAAVRTAATSSARMHSPCARSDAD